MHAWWSEAAKWFAAALIGAGTCGAAETRREFEILVPVPPALTGEATRITPDTLTAWLGNTRLDVLSVQGRERASHTPIVVVLDLLHTETEQLARVAAEVIPLLPELQRRRALVISTAPTQGLIETLYFGSGSRVSMVKAGGADDLEKLAQACREHAAGCPGIVSWGYQHRGTKIVPALSRAFDASQAPVRVFWLSGDQVWWEVKADELRPSPQTASWAACLPNVSEAGISVFPIFMPDATGFVGPDSEPEANATAAENGGVVATAAASPGEALRKLLQMTDNSLVVRLSGPVTDAPRKLRIASKAPAVSLHFERRFVINPPGYQRDESLLKEVAVRVALPSGDLHLRPGCGAQRVFADDLKVTMQLPDAVMSAPAGRLDTWVEYSHPVGKAFTERLALTRPQRQGLVEMRGGVCLPMATGSMARGELKFRLFVFDETTGWLGAVSARLSK